MAGIPSKLARKADERGMKCNYIARVVGVQPWELSRIAKGKQAEPWPGFFERVAGMLGCDPADIRPGQELAAA